MIKDTKYILKRVIIGVLIALILGFINSCEVHAEEYPLDLQNATYYVATTNSTTTITGAPNQFINAQNYGAYYRFILPAEIQTNYNGNYNTTMLYNGQYLVEFYVYSNRGIRENLFCYNLTSNFQNINITTGNWVSNEIKSQCVDLYKTTYNSVTAYRILYKFTYNGGSNPGINYLRFDINSSPNDFYAYNNLDVIGVSMSNIYDYDPNIVSQFNIEKNGQVQIEKSQTIINQNTQLINGQTAIINNNNTNTNSIINNQTQNKNDIINNNNTNTNSIINNAVENAENIINEAKQNTEAQIESQKVCKKIKITKTNIVINNKYLNVNGELINDATWGVTEYIEVNELEKLTSTGNEPSLCFYNENKELISCRKNTYVTIGAVSLPTNTKYIRASINKNRDEPNYDAYACINGNQAMNDTLNETNDTLKDDSVDDPDEYFDEFEDLMADNGVITDLITLPISLYTKILNNINGNCTPFNLGQLLGTDLQFGCINIGNLIGNTLWNIIDILVSGMFVLIIAKRMIKVFENMTSMRESDDLE